MIELGINDTAMVGMDAAGCFGVELSRICLPHMPVPQSVFNALKLSKHELPCQVQINGKVHSSPGFKVVSLVSLLKDGKQVIRGKIRSVGVGINLATIIRADRPEHLKFQLLYEAKASAAVQGATDIVKINGWALILDR